jgi:alpha-1,3-glucosyltransferase
MVLAVHFKQMALYFGLPFGVYAFMLILRQAKLKHKESLLKQLTYVAWRLALLVMLFVASNLVILYPFIAADGLSGAQQVLIRIFPVKRGLFENNVASFWCVLHNFYKVKFTYDQPTQIKLAAAATIMACMPSVIYLMRTPNPK